MLFSKKTSADHALRALVDHLSQALGSKLVSVLLYGSKASEEYREERYSTSVLADVICTHPDCYLKFRLKSGGYVIGHPRKYSLHGKEECIFLDNAARRPPKPSAGGNQPPEVPIGGHGIILLKFDDVSAVEVL